MNDSLRAFDGVTRHAMVYSITQESYLEYPVPTYIVDFKIFNLEEFTKDIVDYCWNSFNQEFTKQLDDVLEEE